MDSIEQQSQAYQLYAKNREPIHSDEAKIRALEDRLGINQEAKPEKQKTQQQPDSEFMKHIKEMPVQAAGGGLDAIQEIGNTVIGFADWAEDYAAKQGIGSGDLIPDGYRMDWSKDIVPPPQTMTGSLTRGISQFMIPYLGAAKAIKLGQGAGALSHLVRGFAAGAAVDFAAFDPKQERLSNLIQDVPELRNPVTAYLASDPKDSDAEGRLKNTLEGMGLGAITEGLMLTFKAIRGVKAAKGIEAKPPADPQAVLGSPEMPAPAQIVESAKPGELDQAVQQMNQVAKVAKEKGVSFNQAEKIILDGKETSLAPLAPEGGNFLEVVGKADPEGKAVNINLNKIDGSTDLKKTIRTMADHFKGEIDEARRGVISDQEVSRLASDLNLTPDQLLDRTRGQALNAEQLMASRVLLNKSADDLLSKAKLAFGPDSTDVAKAAFLDALDAHRAIQAHVSGAIAESGRALRSLRLTVGLGDGAAKARMIKEIVDSAGGRNGIEKIAERLSNLKDVKDISKVIEKTGYQKLSDATFEVYVNSLLSSPATHLANAISNATAVAVKAPERAFGRMSTVLRGGGAIDGVAEGEVVATVIGGFQGFMDGVRLAWNAAKGKRTGDVIQKVELNARRAIGAHLLPESLEQGIIGHSLDLLGNIVSLPGRAIITSDELFKAVNYRMELHALAVRDSVRKGLNGEEFSKNVKRVLENPPDDIHLAAVDEARASTFTKPLEGSYKDLDNIIKKVPGLRIVAPFVRTPLNLVQYKAERIPMLNLAFKNIRDDLAAGGVRADMAKAKMSFGGSIMATTSLLAAQGTITGGGPRDPNARKLLEETGWRPYSLKVGDTYYSYNRFAPFGSVMGMAADFTELAGSLFDEHPDQAERLALVSMSLIAKGLTPELLTENMANLIEAIENPEKGGKSFIAQLAASAVPASGLLRQIRKSKDPLRRDTSPDPESTTAIWDQVVNEVRNVVPGFSESLPPRLNIFGEPVHYDPGFGPDIISPIATSKQKDDPVATELVRLGMAGPYAKPQLEAGEEAMQISMPPRVININGFRQELTPQEYHDYVKLSAGVGLKGAHRTLKEELHRLVSSDFRELGPNRGDEARKLVIKQIISKYRSAASSQLLMDNSSLYQRVRNQAGFRMMKLRGEQ